MDVARRSSRPPEDAAHQAFSSETRDAMAGPLDLIVLDPLADKL